jgi:endonuclease IV
MNTPDKLDEIFRLQRELNLQIGVDTAHMNDKEREQWLLNYCRAMSQEIAEVVG